MDGMIIYGEEYRVKATKIRVAIKPSKI